jgi:hypothetical protein
MRTVRAIGFALWTQHENGLSGLHFSSIPMAASLISIPLSAPLDYLPLFLVGV